MQTSLLLLLVLIALGAPLPARSQDGTEVYGIAAPGIGTEETLEYLMRPGFHPDFSVAGVTQLYLSRPGVSTGDYPAGFDSPDCTSPAAPCETWGRVVDDCIAVAGCVINIDAGDAQWLRPSATDNTLQIGSAHDPFDNRVFLWIRSSRPGTVVEIDMSDYDGTGAGAPGLVHLIGIGGWWPGTDGGGKLVVTDVNLVNSDSNGWICDQGVRCILVNSKCPSQTNNNCYQSPGGDITVINGGGSTSATEDALADANEHGKLSLIGGTYTMTDSSQNSACLFVSNADNDDVVIGDEGTTLSLLRVTALDTSFAGAPGSAIVCLLLDHTVAASEHPSLYASVRVGQSLIAGADNPEQSCFEWGSQRDTGDTWFELVLMQSSMVDCRRVLEYAWVPNKVDLSPNRYEHYWNVFSPANSTSTSLVFDAWDVNLDCDGPQDPFFCCTGAGTGICNHRWTEGVYRAWNNLVVEPWPVSETFIRIRHAATGANCDNSTLAGFEDNVVNETSCTFTDQENHGARFFFAASSNTALSVDPYAGQPRNRSLSCVTSACEEKLTKHDVQLFELATPLDNELFPGYQGPEVSRILLGRKCRDAGYDGECYGFGQPTRPGRRRAFR